MWADLYKLFLSNQIKNLHVSISRVSCMSRCVWMSEWSCQTEVCACVGGGGGVSAVNKRLLDERFGEKSWLGLLINHWPSCRILTSLRGFICLSCWCTAIGHPTSPLFGEPSSLPLLSYLFCRLYLLMRVTCSLLPAPLLIPLQLARSSQGLAETLLKTLFSIPCPLNWFCWGKERRRRDINRMTYLCRPLICVIFKKRKYV